MSSSGVIGFSILCQSLRQLGMRFSLNLCSLQLRLLSKRQDMVCKKVPVFPIWGLAEKPSNKHADDLSVNWLEKSTIDLLCNTNVVRKRPGTSDPNQCHILNWIKNYKWKNVVLPLDDETNALIKILKKFGYKKEHNLWTKNNRNGGEEVVFASPVASDLVNFITKW